MNFRLNYKRNYAPNCYLIIKLPEYSFPIKTFNSKNYYLV